MDLRELLRLNAFAAGFTQRRFDSPAAFVQNELTDLIPQLYDKKYPALAAREHIPVSTNVNPGAMSWAYDSFELAGEAEWLSAGGTDIPRADIAKERIVLPVRAVALAFGWTMEEINAANFAGTPLERRKGDAAKRGTAVKEHKVLLYGDVGKRIPGFLTNPSTPVVVVPNGDWLNPATTADQMLEDLNSVVDQVEQGSEEVHVADTVLMPLSHLRAIQKKPRTTQSDETVLEFFMRTNPSIKEVKHLREMSTAGTGSTPMMMAYQKDPEMVSGVVPMPFTILPPEIRGMSVLINTWERIGGTAFFYELSACKGEGI